MKNDRVLDLMDYAVGYKKQGTPIRLIEDHRGVPLMAFEGESSTEDNFHMFLIGKYGKTYTKVGNTHYTRIDDDKLMLDLIYIEKEFRGDKLGDALYDFSELMVQPTGAKSTIGVFYPCEMDRRGEPRRVLKNRAQGLYTKKGFDIITMKEYLDNKAKYPYSKWSDFSACGGLDLSTLVIYKPMSKTTFNQYGLHLTRDGVLLPKRLMHKYRDCFDMG